MQGGQGAALAAGSRAGMEEEGGARTPHPALVALCALARFHRVAADAGTLAHQLGCGAGEDIHIDLLLRAARQLGLKAVAPLPRSSDRISAEPGAACSVQRAASESLRER